MATWTQSDSPTEGMLRFICEETSEVVERSGTVGDLFADYDEYMWACNDIANALGLRADWEDDRIGTRDLVARVRELIEPAPLGQGAVMLHVTHRTDSIQRPITIEAWLKAIRRFHMMGAPDHASIVVEPHANNLIFATWKTEVDES